MPVGPIGSVWASDTWSDTTWEVGTWGEAEDAIPAPIWTRAANPLVQQLSRGVQPQVTRSRGVRVLVKP
jgi:hypothetical protein